ncbi:hypothetical protein GA0115254_10766 [Streptomyces sp. Ncost-T10-10d]|nr:hypothetical protein GA0115254_10766 [Streptomyces sp. Ncost-T10-10d]
MVTAATSAPGSRRTASGTAVQDVRPVSSAATTEHGQAAAHPSPGRDTGLLLGGAQRRAGRAASVADNGLAQVVAVYLTGSDNPDIHCHADHATRL